MYTKSATLFKESASPFFLCVTGVYGPALALPLPGPGVLTPELSEVSSCLNKIGRFSYIVSGPQTNLLKGDFPYIA